MKIFRKVPKTFKALSLLEVSFVLIIMSLMTFAVMKGVGLVRKTQVNRLSNDVQVYISAAQYFKNENGQLPGLYSESHSPAPIYANTTQKFFAQLQKSGLVNVKESDSYSTPIGGYYVIDEDNGDLWIKICKDSQGSEYYSISSSQWSVLKHNENIDEVRHGNTDEFSDNSASQTRSIRFKVG
ncbi:hypothetical protein FZC35_00075 [Candidatus Cytomitobacter indipagum]|uniref:Type II secretion system protein n=1 Tax=Candidatus Cytomitobacter indipagum TaxID=2601575 RepID=A0A5C0UFG1_9PROT|nr:hypothetical protein [Candidatus Cytomitobacter indipagum]QEK37794.1 hypothetical protein FZC35_00075 [Candidatus Cytomitobacter indipagum]